jgi:hypothetical protein
VKYVIGTIGALALSFIGLVLSAFAVGAQYEVGDIFDDDDSLLS